MSSIDFLASSVGQMHLNWLSGEDLSDSQTLSVLTRLRKTCSPEQAGAALEMARLRVKAVEKFGADAARMFFTREALEQASDPRIRRYRAAGTGIPHVLDACCGIGSDSLAFARSGSVVTGMDNDPVRIAIARYNTSAVGLTAHFELADVRDGLPPAECVFFDPARRDADGRRIYDVEQYHPPLSLIRQWRANLIMVKLSPGLDLKQVAAYEGAVEFISVNGDLKEALLWFGDGYSGLKATLLLNEQSYHWLPSMTPAEAPFSEPRRWMVEPDPALLRTGLVQDVALEFDGYMLDPTIAYFTADTKPDSPWLRAWEILDWMPFNLKRLRAYLRERRVGQVTVKKRGSPLTPESLIHSLKLKGDEARTLVLTRCQDRPIVLICQDA